MMKALFLADGNLRLKNIPKPIPLPHEALIKVLKAGICNTDLELIKGYMGFNGVPGHEFVGRVVQSPRVEWMNRRVVGEINIACGSCDVCLQGRTKHCPGRSVLGISGRDGAFAEYLALPLENLHWIPESVSDSEAVFIEPLAAACDILDQISIDDRTSVAVLGDGKLGLLISLVMKLKTPQVCCYGKYDKKLDILRKAGIRVSTQTGGEKRKFDIVIEATGHVSGLNQSLSLVRPEGLVVLKSTLQEQVPMDTSKIVIDEIRLIGSRCGPFKQAIDLLRNRSIRVKDLVHGEFSLERFEDAFDSAANSEVVKVLFVP